MAPPGGSHGENQLVGYGPAGGKNFLDSPFGLQRELQGTLKMCLNDELAEADFGCFFPEFSQDVKQLIIHAHGKVSQKP